MHVLGKKRGEHGSEMQQSPFRWWESPRTRQPQNWSVLTAAQMGERLHGIEMWQRIETLCLRHNTAQPHTYKHTMPSAMLEKKRAEHCIKARSTSTTRTMMFRTATQTVALGKPTHHLGLQARHVRPCLAAFALCRHRVLGFKASGQGSWICSLLPGNGTHQG